MLFSIITPVYNTEKYLPRCVESVKKQKFTDFEYIMVDDGSTDGSGRLCDAYAKNDDRIRVVHKKNGGQGCARNVAISMAMGEYLLFLDSDDRLEEGLLLYLDEIIKRERPELIIYMCTRENERNRKRELHMNRHRAQEIRLNKRQLWEEYLKNDRVGGWACNKCIQRELLLENRLEYPQIRAREDSWFVSRLFQIAERVVLTDYIGYIQLLRYGGTEQKPFTKDFFMSIEITESIMEYIENTFVELYPLAYRKRLRAKLTCLETMTADWKSRLYAGEAKKIRDSLREDFEYIKGEGDYKEELEMIDMIFHRPIRWKARCLKLGLQRKEKRVRRFLYAKVCRAGNW